MNGACGSSSSESAPGACAEASYGSATAELLVVVPFVLMLLAAVWDLRQFIAYRAELARQMFVLAQAVAKDAAGASPFEPAVLVAERRFRLRSTAGAIHAAVVVRGTRRADGSECPDDDWCPPMVQVAWPGTAVDPAGTWSDAADNPCAPTVDSALPAQGSHFGPGRRVLPDEGAAAQGQPAHPEHDWISRNMAQQEWWVVVDTCVEPAPGLFIGRLVNLSSRMLDTPYVWRRRAAWPSIHVRGDCNWCDPRNGEGT